MLQYKQLQDKLFRSTNSMYFLKLTNTATLMTCTSSHLALQLAWINNKEDPILNVLAYVICVNAW